MGPEQSDVDPDVTDDPVLTSVATLEKLAFSLENESAALEADMRYAARMQTSCLSF